MNDGSELTVNFLHAFENSVGGGGSIPPASHRFATNCRALSVSEMELARALGGGILIGGGGSALLLLNGQIAGVSGILGNLVRGSVGDQAWRIAFVPGLVAPAAVFGTGPAELPATLALSAVSGVLVGFGTRFGGGCTSGHGVCGLANFSTRSLVATLIFMATAALTVYLTRHGLAR